MKVKRRKNPEPHIPFISLADIAWQIIIFFLVASTFAASEALKIDMPNTSEQAKNQPSTDKALTVVASQAALTLDGQPVAINQLTSVLSEKLAGKKSEQERAVVFVGQPDLQFQRNADIMYAIQKAHGVLILAEEE